MDDMKHARNAAERAVEDNVAVIEGSRAIFLPIEEDIDALLDILDEHNGDEGDYLVAELRAQLRKQQT